MNFIKNGIIKHQREEISKLRLLLAGQTGILDGLVGFLESKDMSYMANHLKQQIKKIEKELYGK